MLGFSFSKADSSKKSYTCAGRRAFLHRFADTGFKTKWCGVWVPPVKCFDYFAYRLNGAWLSGENQVGCMLKAWHGAKHIFSLGGFEAEELSFAPKDKDAVISLILLKNTSKDKKEAYLEVEAAANLRAKDENWHDRQYKWSFDEAREAVTLESERGLAMFGAGNAAKKMQVEFFPAPFYKDHKPGSEQRCFIAGKYAVRLEVLAGEIVKIPFVYAGSSSSKADMLDSFDFCAKTWEALLEENVREGVVLLHSQGIDTPVAEINKAFLWSEANLSSLVHRADFGTGVFAGYPWFTEFWGRDALWSAIALIGRGDFLPARETLRTLAANYNGRIPCRLDMYGKAEYYAADTDPLFLIALDRYTDSSGDFALAEELEPVVKKILSRLELVDYIVQHKPEETWMDTLSRKGSAVEMQALWAEALKHRDPKLAALMKKRLGTSFWNNDAGFLFDAYGRAPDPARTANALVPVMFNQLKKDKSERIMKAVSEEFSTLYGIRTRSKSDKEYKPDGYHTGSVWGLTTGWAASAYLALGMAGEGVSCLEDMAEDIHRQGGEMSECLNADTGELIGAPFMAWSHAMFIHAVDSHLFGIRPRLTKGLIFIEPKMPDTWSHMYRHGKKIGNLTMNMQVERVTGGVRMLASFDRAPVGLKLEILLPPWVSSIEHNKKKIRGNNISIEPRMENVIIGRV